MNIQKTIAAAAALLFLLAGCTPANSPPETAPAAPNLTSAAEILLSDDVIQVNGTPTGTDEDAAVYTANDIVYYEAGRDFTYGEGTQSDAHSPKEAAAHTVVHITQPGAYRLKGTLSKGQIAVDLGENAETDPEAVVTLILDGVDITCEVAPAVIFYNVYECGTGEAVADVDTSAAGANVILADESENTIRGSYVARIYKPGSVILSEDGAEVEDAKKLHKYDGAFYSKMSMNIFGDKKDSGILNIYAENEGLGSEMHLTINGGSMNIYSGNDGINTNEDAVSVTTINGGTLAITVTGETGEGDGIDSNGWLVINGGTVIAEGCAYSADAGIDSDMGIHINGGTVIATGHMLDRIEESGQNYAVFSFGQRNNNTEALTFRGENGSIMFEYAFKNDFSILIYSSPMLTEGTYTLWQGDTQLKTVSGGNMMAGGPGMQSMAPGDRPGEPGLESMNPGGDMPPQLPDNMEFPEGTSPFDGQQPPDMPEPPQGGFPEQPDDSRNPGGNFPEMSQQATDQLHIQKGGNYFQVLS